MEHEIIAIPEFRDRISPILDVAQRFILVEIRDGQRQRQQVIEFSGNGGFHAVSALHAMGVSVIICDRVSCHMLHVITCKGLRLIPYIQGTIEEVLSLYGEGAMDTTADTHPCRKRGERRRCRRGNGSRLKEEDEE